mgnify:CR=1 FL=1
MTQSTEQIEVTIGTDPEFFLEKDGKPVSAHDLVPGTKHEPYPLGKSGAHVQADGTAVEINIKPAKNINGLHIRYIKTNIFPIPKSHLSAINKYLAASTSYGLDLFTK